MSLMNSSRDIWSKELTSFGTKDQNHESEIIDGAGRHFALHLKNFCNMSTLHGFQYFIESERPRYERVFWLIAVISAIFGMVVTIKSQLHYYLSNPMMVTTSGKLTSVWEIPFPAISVCTYNQAPVSLVNITELIKAVKENNLTTTDMVLCKFLNLMCEESNSEPLKLPDNDIALKEFYTFTHSYSIKLCRRVFKNFNWRDTMIDDPCSLMQPTLHFAGFCFTFNMLPPKSLYTKTMLNSMEQLTNMQQPFPFKYKDWVSSWSLGNGYRVNSNNSGHEIPYRVTSGSFINSANIVLDFGMDGIQDQCRPGSYTFLCYIHAPHEWPTLDQPYFLADINTRVAVRIKPKLIKTDDLLRSWSPEERGCYFNNERQLLFFAVYSFHNCNLECDANYTLTICNCNILYQPHLATTPVCGIGKEECYYRATLITTDPTHRDSHFSACNCLPSCSELSYKIYPVSENRNFTHNPTSFSIPPNITLANNVATLIVSYYERNFNTIQRVGLMSQSDLIANVGGLLGLFLGFSFISLFEILYFSTVRWMTDVWNYKKCFKWKKKNNTKSDNILVRNCSTLPKHHLCYALPFICNYCENQHIRNIHRQSTSKDGNRKITTSHFHSHLALINSFEGTNDFSRRVNNPTHKPLFKKKN